MEKWDYFEKFKNHLNPLPMDKILFGQSLKHYIKLRKVLEINLKPGRLLFLCVLLESFEKFLPDPYLYKSILV